MTPRVGDASSSFDVSDLNKEQAEAVMHTRGPLLVLAGAGSGKTKTLVYRMARLIHDGVDPKRILLLTFTRKASQEMMRRACGVLDARCQQVVGGTFHSFCNMVLHQYATQIEYQNGFTIMDRSDAENLMALIRKQGDYQKKDKRFPKKNTLLDMVSKSVNTNRSIEQVLMDDFPHFYDLTDDVLEIAKKYHIQKEALNLMDYDDLLVKMVHLLNHHPNIRQQLSKKYQYIMVDEFQDTNHIQLAMLKGLASEHQNLMVVGDDAQSIYSFRGADIQNILTFETMFDNVTTIRLSTNYRSTQPILDVSSDVINHDVNLYEKALVAARSGGEKPKLVEAFDDMEQADFVVDRLLSLREEGVSLTSMAVLFRSSSHSSQVELALTRANIPYKKYGGFKFTETAHIKDAMAYMKVMVNPDDELSWHRVLQLLDGVGPKLSQQIINYQREQQFNFSGMDYAPFKKKAAHDELLGIAALMATTNGMAPTDVLQRVLDAYQPVLKKTYDDFHKREQDLNALVALSARFRSLAAMLDEFTLEPPESSQVGADAVSDDDEHVVLSTIHSAKGLEWSRVFVLSVVDGYIPSFRSLQDPAQIEEERRLLYVAMTRAKDDLYLIKPNLDDPSAYYPMGGMSFSQLTRFISPDQVDRYFDTWSLGVGEAVGNDDPFGDDAGKKYSL
ncbi:MAG: ATP-dependent helicase [Candidatus Margulisbacteria bacterium]|nr:ATP-dependent helicase [Candidatus Margulisiibacteriota bacterium]